MSTPSRRPPRPRRAHTLLLAGLGANMVAGARLAMFLPVRAAEFRVSVGHYAMLFAFGLLAWFAGGVVREGFPGYLNTQALTIAFAHVPVVLFTFFLVGLLFGNLHLALAMAVMTSGSDWLFEIVGTVISVGLHSAEIDPFLQQALSIGYLAWAFAAIVRAMWLATGWHGWRSVGGAGILLVLFTGLVAFAPRDELWTAYRPDGLPQQLAGESIADEELFHAQDGLLAERLDALAPQRPGVQDLYFLGAAPYAQQDVFLRELAWVKTQFEQRFDAKDRSLALANRAETARELPLATATNLRQSLRALGEVMDTEEDILFLYLTTHGSAGHELAFEFPPLRLRAVTPTSLSRMLADSGIKWKVIVVSACYSGGFIEPLRDDNTLVITAAAANKTSFGCENGRDFTYFGKAFFADSLSRTLSFAEAFAGARALVAAQEQAEGLVPSEPQMHVGKSIAPRLAELERRLREGSATPAPKVQARLAPPGALFRAAWRRA